MKIISGHNRVLAAQKAGWPKVPCWVRELDDDEAYMQLVLCNTQSELHPLEEGKHAAESGMDLKAYAERAGKARTTLADKVKAWRVLAMTHVRHANLRDSWRNLAEIHAAPQWLWSALVAQMLADGWTVAQTRAKVAELKETAASLARVLGQVLGQLQADAYPVDSDSWRLDDKLSVTHVGLDQIRDVDSDSWRLDDKLRRRQQAVWKAAVDEYYRRKWSRR